MEQVLRNEVNAGPAESHPVGGHGLGEMGVPDLG